MAMKSVFYVDGCSIGNPGRGGIGIVVSDENGKVITTYSATLPHVTNNEAEYHAVLEALRWAKRLGADELTLFSDSELIVRQLNGIYKVSSPKLKKLRAEALALIPSFRRVVIRHIPRKQNELANRLAQQAAKGDVEGGGQGAVSEATDKPLTPHAAPRTPHPVKIAPSILSADFRRLGEVIGELESAGADWVHFDVMDGRFVPNISFGLPVIEALRSETKLPFDVHLMIVEPERYIAEFIKAGADIVSVHPETTYHPHRVTTQIKELGAKAGIALNPATPPDVIRPILPMLDVVLVMSVDPGFAGQSFLPFVLDKVKTLRQWIDETGLPIELEIDGGVNGGNAAQCVAAGATVLVSASGIFQSGKSIAEAVQILRQAATLPVDFR